MKTFKIAFEKFADGLLPVIIQDAVTLKVLMLGYMNEEAFEKTVEGGLVTFYSRSRKTLWTKGETSGNFLKVAEMRLDCDKDTLLIKAEPCGPVCHTGSDTCFDERNETSFISTLEEVIASRRQVDPGNSYTALLFSKGISAIAQKVGEEAVELVIEAMRHEDEKFKDEAADLLFHYLVLLQSKGFKLDDVLQVLANRHSKG